MEEKKEEGTCGKGGCGMHCGCCACKAIKGLVLIMIGVGIGFCISHCCHRHRMMCRMETAASMQPEGTPMPTTPAAPHKTK